MTEIQRYLEKHDLKFNPQFDDAFHNIKTDSFKGWYIAFVKYGVETLIIKDWREVNSTTVKNSTRTLTSEDLENLDTDIKAKSKEIKQIAAKKASELYQAALPSTAANEYFNKKKIPLEVLNQKDFPIKQDAENYETSLIPILNKKLEVVNIQKIFFNGDKEYVAGGEVSGCFYVLGDIAKSDILYICEGVATGASIHLATQKAVIVAFFAANLKKVSSYFKNKYPTDKEIILAGDDDTKTAQNTGKIAAIQASTEIGSYAVFPTFKVKADSLSDFNDLHVTEGIEKVKEQLSTGIETEWMGDKELAESIFLGKIKQGFHIVKMQGNFPTLVPDVEGLKTFLNYKKAYKSLSTTKQVFGWSGTYYEEMSDIELGTFAHRFFNPPPKPAVNKEFKERIFHTNNVNVDWFGKSTEGLINLNNGVLNLDTLEFDAERTSSRGFRYCLPYDYDPNAIAPKFTKMLMEIFDGDEARFNILLEFMGYALSGDTCYTDKVMVLTGEGSNGKSRTMKIIKAILGKSMLSMKAKQIDKDTMIGRLNAGLLCLFEEMPSFTEKDFWEEIKGLASGKDVLADKKFKEAWEFENRCKFVFTCNTLPYGTDPTHGFFRKLLIVPFNRLFDENDPNTIKDLDQQIIKEELSGVFNMIVKAYRRLREAKYQFSQSSAVTDAVQNYKEQVDSVLSWLKENEAEWSGDKEFKHTLKDLYQDYRDSSVEDGLKPVNKKEFRKRLERNVPQLKGQYKKVKDKGVLGWGYQGLEFKMGKLAVNPKVENAKGSQYTNEKSADF